jgi:hypothetical protein
LAGVNVIPQKDVSLTTFYEEMPVKKIDIAVVLALMALAVMVNGLSAKSVDPTTSAVTESATIEGYDGGDDGDVQSDEKKDEGATDAQAAGDDGAADDGDDNGFDTEEPAANPGAPE